MNMRPRLARRPEEGMLLGVAAGVAERYSVDPTLVRLGFVAVAVITGGVAVVGYLIAGILMPRADDTPGIQSLRHGVDDLVARGRELYGETARVVDRARSGRADAEAPWDEPRPPTAE